jgi:hypothetical protein
LNHRGSIPSRGKIRVFSSSPQSPDRLSGPPSLPDGMPGVLSPAIKQPEREADLSLSSSAEDKFGGAIPALHNAPSWHGAY